jgi:glycogen operon protein
LENGEQNKDGSDDNLSWNCGVEGATDDPEIQALRLRCAKNAMALLLVSQGVPMLNMGDEFGRTQRGNNNAYCHDTEWNWLDWRLAENNADLLRFVRLLVHFRRQHGSLHREDWFSGTDCVGSGYPDISWHGVKPGEPDWGEHSHSLAFMICGQHDHAMGGPGEFFYAAFNMHNEPLSFELPALPAHWQWHLLADTSRPSPGDIHEPGQEPLLEGAPAVHLIAHSAVLCLGREPL